MYVGTFRYGVAVYEANTRLFLVEETEYDCMSLLKHVSQCVQVFSKICMEC